MWCPRSGDHPVGSSLLWWPFLVTYPASALVGRLFEVPILADVRLVLCPLLVQDLLLVCVQLLLLASPAKLREYWYTRDARSSLTTLASLAKTGCHVVLRRVLMVLPLLIINNVCIFASHTRFALKFAGERELWWRGLLGTYILTIDHAITAPGGSSILITLAA